MHVTAMGTILDIELTDLIIINYKGFDISLSNISVNDVLFLAHAEISQKD